MFPTLTFSPISETLYNMTVCYTGNDGWVEVGRGGGGEECATSLHLAKYPWIVLIQNPSRCPHHASDNYTDALSSLSEIL